MEQDCPYPELDGRDDDPDAWHCWIADGGGIVAYLRILPEAEGSWIGRVVTAPHARGAGHAETLLRHALGMAARPVSLHAQAHLRDWYARLGFTVAGSEFLEDGIPHVPMRMD